MTFFGVHKNHDIAQGLLVTFGSNEKASQTLALNPKPGNFKFPEATLASSGSCRCRCLGGLLEGDCWALAPGWLPATTCGQV